MPTPNEPTRRFIATHANDDVRQLALRGCADKQVDLPFALDQIAGRQTALHKLPSWAATEGLFYPTHLSMEQCSSEATARYKADHLAARLCGGGTLLDMTGGLGVDFAFMAKAVSGLSPDAGGQLDSSQQPAASDQLVYVEQREQLCDLARHNLPLLGLSQATIVCGDGASYLRQASRAFDLVYLDPARRDLHGARTYALGDCTPDVLSLLPLLQQKSAYVLLKLSPMLDWRKAVSDLGEARVREVHIVSVGNECKELLVLLSATADDGFRLFCVNDDQVFEVHEANEPATSISSDGDPSQFLNLSFSPYLYEPNASVMKAGCYASVERAFGVSALSANSHLFLSPQRVEGFPGREFQVDAVTSLNKHSLKTHLEGISRANITVRNFPLSVAELRRRLKLGEGGSTYLFATTLASRQHVLLVCHKPTSSTFGSSEVL